MSLKSDLINGNGWLDVTEHNLPPEHSVLTKGDRRIVLKYNNDGTIQASGYAISDGLNSMGLGVYLGAALVGHNSDTADAIQCFVCQGKINYTDILLKKIDFVVDNNDALDRYLRGIKGSEGFPSCYHYVDTSGTFRKYTDRVVIYPDNEEDFGYRFRVNPDGSMYVARFDVEEGLIMDKKDMVNIYSNLLSDLLHHVFSRKKIYV
nr:MAG TPA: nucleotide excision repair protein [Caudoviricetes sp.]